MVHIISSNNSTLKPKIKEMLKIDQINQYIKYLIFGLLHKKNDFFFINVCMSILILVGQSCVNEI